MYFERQFRIHMADCDPAGIVFHPQYFVMITRVMEEFYREIAGVTFKSALSAGLGFPIGGIRCDFCRPSALGDLVTLRLWVEKVGTTSVRFAVRITGEDGVRVECAETVVCVKVGDVPEAMSKHPLPEAFRAALLPYVGEPLALRA